MLQLEQFLQLFLFENLNQMVISNYQEILFLFGASRYVAAEFTFFLAIPVMFGASLLKLVKFGFHYTGAEIFILVVGMATAFVVSIISIKFLLQYIKNNDFKAFGYYRIVLGLIVLAYLYFVGDPTLE